MKPSDFIGDKVQYDRDVQYFWGVKNNTEPFVIAELRGRVAIQNLFEKRGYVDVKKAAMFQDELGEWIAGAINEKLEREKITQPPIFKIECNHEFENGIHTRNTCKHCGESILGL